MDTATAHCSFGFGMDSPWLLYLKLNVVNSWTKLQGSGAYVGFTAGTGGYFFTPDVAWGGLRDSKWTCGMCQSAPQQDNRIIIVSGNTSVLPKTPRILAPAIDRGGHVSPTFSVYLGLQAAQQTACSAFRFQAEVAPTVRATATT